MKDFYIKVSKIDYYTWKIGAIVLLVSLIAVLGARNGVFGETNYVGEMKDLYWHLGYQMCENNYNFTSDEMLIINEYRLSRMENCTETMENVTLKNGTVIQMYTEAICWRTR